MILTFFPLALLAFSVRVLSAPVISAPTNVTLPPVPLSVDTASLKSLSVSPVSAAEVKSYIPYEYFSAAAYCPPAVQANWSCKFCKAEPVKDFIVYANGGDGGLIQHWYVGWWPSGNSVVVGHQGTQLNELQYQLMLARVLRVLTHGSGYRLAVLTDLAFLPVKLDGKRFPGAPTSAAVHFGFQEAHERTATIVLNTVKKVIAERNATKVVTVGHSLGGALALLDGLFLKLNLPSNIEVAVRTIGQPRVGNDVFSDFVDQKVTNLVRVTNKRDLVPALPPLILGFTHTAGEKHINAQNVWNDCSGQDNLDINCSTGQLLKQGIWLTDHLGPYAGGFEVPDLTSCYFV